MLGEVGIFIQQWLVGAIGVQPPPDTIAFRPATVTVAVRAGPVVAATLTNPVALPRLR
jgi:hypothetical protein